MNTVFIIILTIVFLWFFSIFFLSRLIIPFLRFKRYPVPKTIQKGMQDTIDKLRKESRNKEEFLRKSYDFLTTKYHGGRLITIIKPKYHFITDLNEIWKMKGYIPCTIHNYLLRVFLVRSGIFEEEDIMIVYTFLNMNIHQYLKVKVNGNLVDVDPAGAYFGAPFGKHTRLFK